MPSVSKAGSIRARLNDLYAASDAFVLASLYEGTPIVLMEAMAMEIPCIASAINGIPELIAHGQTGVLFPPADPARLAECIQSLMDDPELAARLGRAATGLHLPFLRHSREYRTSGWVVP